MTELRRVPPPELRAVEHPRTATTAPERVTPAERPSAPRIRAETAEHRATSPPETHNPKDGKRQQTDQIPDSLARFEPKRAGLPDVSKKDANHYIETQRGERPWLNAARNARPEVQQVFAALDQGRGHAHIRHEGWLSPEKSQLRVQYMQDPAQLDPVKRAEGKDGLAPSKEKHFCGPVSSAIRDPMVFAVAFTRGTEHPDLRRALETPLDGEHDRPGPVGLPIADILGPEGHHHCEGYQLIGDDWKQAVQDRKTWVKEAREGEIPSVPTPLLAPVDFRGGTLEFRFKANKARTGYEVSTMFPDPPR